MHTPEVEIDFCSRNQAVFVDRFRLSMYLSVRRYIEFQNNQIPTKQKKIKLIIDIIREKKMIGSSYWSVYTDQY